MTLTNRVSVFFLSALAVVLAGFSIALFLLARTYLYRQVDERLDAALETLSAAVEESPEGVEWEPAERRFSLGQDGAIDQVRWVVVDPQGRIVDHSRNLSADDPLADQAWLMTFGTVPGHEDAGQSQPRRVLQRRVPEFTSAGPVRPRPTEQASSTQPNMRYPAVALTAGLSLEPVRATLWNLALVLGGLSLAVWILSASLGRWLCRRALVPVTRMASSARAIEATDRDRRLPVAGTGDELEDLGRAFNDLLTRLQESFERQRRFAGDASHQLRTPLTAMLGQVEVALRRERAPEEYQRTLALVREQAVQLHGVVETLLFLTRVEAEAKLHELDWIDLNAWLQEYLRPWEDRPRGKDLKVMVSSSNGSLRVTAHATLLGQLVGNLLDNACKYSDPGTPITICLGREACHAFLSVEDVGQGILPLDLPHVFEPFYRAPEARRLGQAGIGLGLAVARRIATALGGTLDVYSRPGQGSRFTLHFPDGSVGDP